MKQSGKKTLALLLAVCLLLSLLAGCGKKDNTQQLSATVYVPKYLDLNIDVDYINGGCSDGENIYLIGERSEEIRQEIPGSEDSESTTYTTYRNFFDIYRIALDGSGQAEKLPNYQAPEVPDGKDGSSNVSDIAVSEDGSLWVTESLYIWGSTSAGYPEPGIAVDMPVARAESATAESEDADTADADAPVDEPVDESSETIVRRKLDKDGNELARIDMSNLQENMQSVIGEDEYLNTQSFDAAGNLYVGTETKIYALDDQMNVRFELEGEDMWYNLVPLSGGLMGMQKRNYDEETQTSSNKLMTIDPEKQDWGTEYVMPNNASNIYPGGGDYLFYYQVNDAVFGFKADETAEGGGTGERLFSWIEADISSDNVRNFFFLPDGRVAAVLQEYDDNYENMTVSVALLTPTPRDQLPEKTTLVYASLYLSYDARRKIIDFNKKSETHRIEVKDYAEFDTDGTGQASLQKLNTEILAGNVPDILDTTGLPLRQYGSKGILEDLWPFIENDADIGGREGLMDRVFTAAEQDGKLYQIFSTFSISTVLGAPSVVGYRNTWTLQDMQDALAKMPEGCSVFSAYNTKDSMLQMVLSMNLDSFVDWDAGACHFDSEGFKNLLAFCDNFPQEYDWGTQEYDDDYTRLSEGRQMLMQTSLSDFQSIQMYKAMFGGEVSFVGFPVEDGGVGSCFITDGGVAMSAACKDKEGAWTFIRELLLPQYGDETEYYGMHNGFPANKADFEWVVKDAMTPDGYETDENGNQVLDENGNPIEVSHSSWGWGNNLTVDIYATKQEEYDQIMDLYNKVDKMYGMDNNVFDIVTEVAGSYFAGDRSLDDAAGLIQNKVTTYVNESR